jgi:hypothetical protein
MPRGGGRRSGGSPVRSRSPVSSVPARTPAPVAPAPAPTAAQPRQPGLFGQMAATAAGVAVGSAVGHSIGAAMSGGGGAAEQAPAEVAGAGQQIQQLDQSGGPCQLHMKQFVECAQTQHDLSLCQGFNEALRECKMRYGITN